MWRLRRRWMSPILWMILQMWCWDGALPERHSAAAVDTAPVPRAAATAPTQRCVTRSRKRILSPLRSPSVRSPSFPSTAPTATIASKTTLTTTKPNVTSVVQIIETEIRVNQTWTSPTDSSKSLHSNDDSSEDDEETTERVYHRWMDATTLQPVDSPLEYQLKRPDQVWGGEWKILIPRRMSTSGSSSSQQGWQYSLIERNYTKMQANVGDLNNTNENHRGKRNSSPLLQYTHRRRVWIRTVISTTQTTQLSSATASTDDAQRTGGTLTKASSLKAKRNRRKQRFSAIFKLVQAVRDDWNFKGLGLTLTKSLLFPDAYGIALRLPLTLNFATWERHSSWPSIGTSMAIFYSGSPTPGAAATLLPNYHHHYWTLALFLHVSLRVEYVKAIAQYVSTIAVPTIVAGLMRILLNGWILAISALLYPITRRMPLVVVSPPPMDASSAVAASTLDSVSSEWSRLWMWPEPPRNRRDSEERLSVSWCWRWTPMLPYEFRTVYGHYFAVQIATLWEAIVIPWLRTTLLLASKVLVLSKASNALTTSVPHWISRHTAAIGLSLSGPLRPIDTGGILITATSIASLSGFYLPVASWFAVRSRRPVSSSSTTTKKHESIVQNSNETSLLLHENGLPRLDDKMLEQTRPIQSPKPYPTKVTAAAS